MKVITTKPISKRAKVDEAEETVEAGVVSTSPSTHATKGGLEGGSRVGRKSGEGANNQRKGHERARTLTGDG